MKINKNEILIILKQNNWNLSDFARELGVSRGTVSRIMNEQRRPGSTFIGAFSKRFPREIINKYFFA